MNMEAYVTALKHVCMDYLGELNEDGSSPITQEDMDTLSSLGNAKMAHGTLKRAYRFMKV